ncbi:MAG: LysM peptidoglycan-binding domain-containing protein, partial [Proteobacteria bacterium]|nr:LysM peptidoglycan-binding domain-containing protein [Pseudomonadota bacterium]
MVKSHCPSVAVDADMCPVPELSEEAPSNGDVAASVVAGDTSIPTPTLDTCQKSHTVAEGDTLWDISAGETGAGADWSSLFAENTGVVDDPDLIFPGQKLEYPDAWVEDCERRAFPEGGQSLGPLREEALDEQSVGPIECMDSIGILGDEPTTPELGPHFAAGAGDEYVFANGGAIDYEGTTGNISLMYAKMKAGAWGEAGEARRGFEAQADGARGETDWHGPVNVEGQTLTAGAEASAGEDGASV